MRMGTNRDYSIDLLKFFAAILITWSHFEKPLGDYSILATGGAFGDALFFFASGYTLLLSKKSMTFFNWYKRRINRIYPTVFAWALICSIFIGGSTNMLYTVIKGGGFFVTCIMIFYLFIYPIKTYFSKRITWIIIIGFILHVTLFFFINHSDYQSVSWWLWSVFFLVMLLGAKIGVDRQTEHVEPYKGHCRFLFDISLLLLSTGFYYIMMYEESFYPFLSCLKIVTLLSFSYFIYRICNYEFFKKLIGFKMVNAVVMTIGGLCLEIYIVQPLLLTDKMNYLFPFNLILMFGIIIVVAYILKCCARLWAQTFKDEDYDWKEIVKFY